MSVDTPGRLDVGAELVFVLRLGDGSAIEIGARVIYCRPGESAAGEGFVSGVQFTNNNERDPDGPGADLMSRAGSGT